jgi:hypothetical protein
MDVAVSVLPIEGDTPVNLVFALPVDGGSRA